MEEDFDFEEMVAKLVVEAERKMARRDVAQQAVERVVGRAGRFNGDDVPNFLEAYNMEMDARGVEEALRLEYFCRVVAEPIHAEVKELRSAHESWSPSKGLYWRRAATRSRKEEVDGSSVGGWHRRGVIGT